MLFLKRLMKSPAVLSIIAIQVAVFVAQGVNSGVADRLSLPGHLEGFTARPWSPLTVMFVHEHIVHLALMVLMLAAFGVLLEHTTHSWHVVAVYLLAGLAGSVAVLAAVAAFETDATLVGASAAVLGVAAAVLVMRPSRKILGGTATQWLVVLVAINLAFLLSQPLSSVAHLVGLTVGAGYGSWLRRRVPADAE